MPYARTLATYSSVLFLKKVLDSKSFPNNSKRYVYISVKSHWPSAEVAPMFMCKDNKNYYNNNKSAPFFAKKRITGQKDLKLKFLV